jgi:hypothetical protein
MKQACTLCNANDASDFFRVCARCATIQGLRPIPPSRRPPVPCTRCNSFRFIRVLPRELTAIGSHGNAPVEQLAAPMALTYQASTHSGWGRPAGPNVMTGIGDLETFVCAGCGFIEWYCGNPQGLPIGHEYNTEIVDYSPEGVYRG